MRDRALQEDRTKVFKKLKNCKGLATQKLRARQLTIDELSSQDEECKSTVNQLEVQIQELQEKVNSLSDAREFYDPETASSSGLSHVPSQHMSISSPTGLIGRDSCLQPDTRNSLCISGHVPQTLPAPGEPPPLKQKELILKVVWWNCISLIPINLVFQCRKTKFKTEVCSCSGCLTVAMLWVKEVDVAKSVDDLMTSQSIRELQIPEL